jgi:hypothetical protein
MTIVESNAGRTIGVPPVRGPWTEALYGLLRESGEDQLSSTIDLRGPEVLDDDDLQMALYLCYELHYAGLEGVDEGMEWSPAVLMLRSALESEFEAALRAVVPVAPVRSVSVGAEIQRLVREDGGPALVEVQADEYGGGRPERIHAELFANTMSGLGLDPRYGAYLSVLPGITLATVNLMSWFGLHRRLRGGLVGHLAAFEMTSSVPNRRYGNGFRRLGYGPEVTDFYDEHVEADAVHESIAVWDLADALARDEPQLAGDILFGVRALLALEARWASHLLDAWRRGESSLIAPLQEA